MNNIYENLTQTETGINKNAADSTDRNNYTNNIVVPVWQKYTLSIQEAAVYFGIGENRLRNIISLNKNAQFVLWNGRKIHIKRKLFEKYIDSLEAV